MSTRRYINLTGHHFGQLTVLEESRTASGVAGWLCQCTCGRKVIRRTAILRIYKSCGCLRGTIGTHHMTCTKFYMVWGALRKRCKNPNAPDYPRYGGRGIGVLWNSFEEFHKDMFKSYEKHRKTHSTTTIERKDNNGPYSKDNCVWATQEEQRKNCRRTVYLTYKNKTLTLVDWARHFNLHRDTLVGRLKRGWSLKRTLNTPLKRSKLTVIQVEKIRQLRGIKSQRIIAKQFGVSSATISAIHTGKIWKTN